MPTYTPAEYARHDRIQRAAREIACELSRMLGHPDAGDEPDRCDLEAAQHDAMVIGNGVIRAIDEYGIEQVAAMLDGACGWAYEGADAPEWVDAAIEEMATWAADE